MLKRLLTALALAGGLITHAHAQTFPGAINATNLVRCDGSTNDATSIQNAVNRVSAPSVVTIAPGQCNITSGITKPVGVSIIGSGQGATLISVGANSITAFTATYGSLTVDSSEISNLQIDCGSTTGTAGISVTFARTFNMRNLTISGCPTTIALDRGQQYRIENVTSKGNLSQGAGVLNIKSTVDTDQIHDVMVHSYFVLNVGNGVQGTAIYCRRCVNVQISKVRMNDLTTGGSGQIGTLIENDSQGNQLSDFQVNRATVGYQQQTGAGVAVAPTFNGLIDFSVDQPATNAINLVTGSRTTINGGMLTASGITTTIPGIAVAAVVQYTTINDMVIDGFNGVGGSCLSLATATDQLSYYGNTCNNNTSGLVWAGATTNTRVFGNRFSNIGAGGVFNGTTTGSGNNFWNNNGTAVECTQDTSSNLTCTGNVIGANLVATTLLVTKSPTTLTGTSGTVSSMSTIINSSGAFTLTLPGQNAGQWLFVLNIAANTVTSASSNVTPRTSTTAGTAVLPAVAGTWAWLQSDGTNWRTLASCNTAC